MHCVQLLAPTAASVIDPDGQVTQVEPWSVGLLTYVPIAQGLHEDAPTAFSVKLPAGQYRQAVAPVLDA
jgi:hypothetical protein